MYSLVPAASIPLGRARLSVPKHISAARGLIVSESGLTMAQGATQEVLTCGPRRCTYRTVCLPCMPPVHVSEGVRRGGADFNFRAKVADFGLSLYKRSVLLPLGASKCNVSSKIVSFPALRPSPALLPLSTHISPSPCSFLNPFRRFFGSPLSRSHTFFACCLVSSPTRSPLASHAPRRNHQTQALCLRQANIRP